MKHNFSTLWVAAATLICAAGKNIQDHSAKLFGRTVRPRHTPSDIVYSNGAGGNGIDEGRGKHSPPWNVRRLAWLRPKCLSLTFSVLRSFLRYPTVVRTRHRQSTPITPTCASDKRPRDRTQHGRDGCGLSVCHLLRRTLTAQLLVSTYKTDPANC